MADRHVIYKNAVKEIAFQQGKSVTFMAKWDYEFAGNSCHLHSSLWTLLTKVETSCDRILIAGGANVEAEWEQGPAV